MLKKTIKYKNLFTNEEVEEDFYFHLTKAELVEMEMSREGGLSESLKRVVASEDGKQIIAEFKNIILSAYGIRSEDGRFFKKTQELSDEFETSEAYSALFMELVTDADAAVKFITGIVPEGLAEEAAEIAKRENQPELSVVSDEPDSEDIEGSTDVKTYTKSDLAKMSAEELADAGSRIASGSAKIEDPSAV